MSDNQSKKLVEEILALSDLVGVSSNEQRISKHIINRLKVKNYVAETDNLGNLMYVPKNESNVNRRVLVFAHMDEIGFIVRKIENNGFIRFERLGGVNTQILPGTKVIFDVSDDKLVNGVIGVQSHHFMPVENKFAIPKITDMYMDIGAKRKSEVETIGINVGTLVALNQKAEVLNKHYICGKSLDNRAAIAIIEQMIEKIDSLSLNYSIIFCFPVMEEFNIRGLLPVYRKYKPDIAVGIDVTPSCDTPDLNYNDIALDKGPAVCVMNFHGGGTLAGVIPDRKLLNSICKYADQNKIEYQREVSPGIITENAFGLFENTEGIRVLNLSIPTRYTHTPIEMMSISDIGEMYELINGLLLSVIPEII